MVRTFLILLSLILFDSYLCFSFAIMLTARQRRKNKRRQEFDGRINNNRRNFSSVSQSDPSDPSIEQYRPSSNRRPRIEQYYTNFSCNYDDHPPSKFKCTSWCQVY
mmetsp:Transcript_20257/g.29290  ORF Transcript_20257/g.29290 Transcript_20257/m.29290 type:complete len:106 (-) Transcript_20257:66-383(-)